MKLATDPTPNERDAAISTQSGQTVRPFDPDPAAVDLADLAHGTANVCRAAGQSRFFYSVALHSLYVSRELERAGEDERTQLYGLLHDASEAYVADVPGPLKKHLPNYKRAEEHVQDAIWAAFELEPPTDEAWTAVKRADGRLQRFELPVLIPSQEWKGDRPALGYDLRLDATDDVPALFESRATELVEATDAARP